MKAGLPNAVYCVHGFKEGYKIRVGDLPKPLTAQWELANFVRSHGADIFAQPLDCNLVCSRGTMGRPYAILTWAEKEDCENAQEFFSIHCDFSEDGRTHNTNASFVDYVVETQE